MTGSKSVAHLPSFRQVELYELPKMENEKYYTELGIKINKLRISVRFPKWLGKAAMEATTAAEHPRKHNDGAEPYWEFRQLSKDGLFLVCTPITTCAAGELVASTSTSRTSMTETLTSSSSGSSGPASSVCCPRPPPVPPKSSPATLAVKPMRPPYPSSTVSKRHERGLKRSSYV